MRDKITKNFWSSPTFCAIFFDYSAYFLHFEDYTSFFIDCVCKKSPETLFEMRRVSGDLRLYRTMS
ncbi:hypothetical protein HMPREF9999_00946 [Alloprevotella sp. oral taxon 473 str. F0040]|nr:hypothetical protein HMPREF9999_00946 [Alloprevotella sp. oral taxon 473 str. F0040]